MASGVYAVPRTLSSTRAASSLRRARTSHRGDSGMASTKTISTTPSTDAPPSIRRQLPEDERMSSTMYATRIPIVMAS